MGKEQLPPLPPRQAGPVCVCHCFGKSYVAEYLTLNLYALQSSVEMLSLLII